MGRKRKKKQLTKEQKSRFSAMSKMIGVIVVFFVSIVLLFSMYEMHRTQDLSSLSELIVGTFTVLTAYIGFYINMAKAEHIEDKKNQIKKELELIRLDGITLEEKVKEEELQQQLEQMGVELEFLKTQ